MRAVRIYSFKNLQIYSSVSSTCNWKFVFLTTFIQFLHLPPPLLVTTSVIFFCVSFYFCFVFWIPYICLFLSDLFNLARCVQGLSIFLQIAVFPSFCGWVIFQCIFTTLKLKFWYCPSPAFLRTHLAGGAGTEKRECVCVCLNSLLSAIIYVRLCVCVSMLICFRVIEDSVLRSLSLKGLLSHPGQVFLI